MARINNKNKYPLNEVDSRDTWLGSDELGKTKNFSPESISDYVLRYIESGGIDPVVQNNFLPTYRTNFGKSGSESVSEAFNNSTTLEVKEDQILEVVNSYQKVVGTAVEIFTDYYLFRAGKGVYGLNSDKPTSDSDFMLHRSEEPVVIVGESGTAPTIETIVVQDNTGDPFTIVNESEQLFEIVDGTDTFFIIVNQDLTGEDSDKVTYRFVGEEGNYGSGSDNSVPSDFVRVSGNTNIPEKEEVNRLVSGSVSSAGGLTFSVSNLAYYIGNTLYNTAPVDLTLSDADENNSRIDVFVANNDGLVYVKEGVPSISPLKAELDPETEVEVSFILVNAGEGSETPSQITAESIWNEDLGEPNEWTVLSSSAQGVEVGSSLNPSRDSLSIRITNGDDSNASLNFINDAPIEVSTFNEFNFDFYLVSGEVREMRVSLYNSDGSVASSVDIADGRFGFDSSNNSGYQKIRVPKSAFRFTGSSFTRILLVVDKSVGISTTVRQEIYLDNINLVLGLTSSESEGIPTSLINSPDTPISYKGAAGKFLQVNQDEDGVEFKEVEVPVTSVNGKEGDVIVDKVDVGLSEVDNTSDLDKPISIAQQAALDEKISTIPTHTGDVTGDIELTITDGVVTEGKIANLAVTEDKLATDSVSGSKIKSGSITGGKLALDTVTNARLANVAGLTFKGNQLPSTASPQDLDMETARDMLGINGLAVNGLSIQDSNSVEKFKVDDFLQFEGVEFDTANKKISVLPSESYYTAYVGFPNADDATAELGNPNKPWETLNQAMVDTFVAETPQHILFVIDESFKDIMEITSQFSVYKQWEIRSNAIFTLDFTNNTNGSLYANTNPASFSGLNFFNIPNATIQDLGTNGTTGIGGEDWDIVVNVRRIVSRTTDSFAMFDCFKGVRFLKELDYVEIRGGSISNYTAGSVTVRELNISSPTAAVEPFNDTSSYETVITFSEIRGVAGARLILGSDKYVIGDIYDDVNILCNNTSPQIFFDNSKIESDSDFVFNSPANQEVIISGNIYKGGFTIFSTPFMTGNISIKNFTGNLGNCNLVVAGGLITIENSSLIIDAELADLRTGNAGDKAIISNSTIHQLNPTDLFSLGDNTENVILRGLSTNATNINSNGVNIITTHTNY